MFMARKVCEMPVMAVLSGPGYARFYSAVEVTLRLPWFIVNTIVQERGERFVRSFNCALERDVADLCLPKENLAVLSIQAVVPDDAVHAGWKIRQIVKVHRGRRFKDQEVVIFEDDGGMEFSGEDGAAPPTDVVDRRLLFSRAAPPGDGATSTKKRKPVLRGRAPILDRSNDPRAMLSAEDLGKLLGGLDAAQIDELESRGEVFSVGDGGARMYPAYQASPALPSGAISRILKALRTHGQNVAPHPFFTSISVDLDKLSPLEVLLGGLFRQRAVQEDVPTVLTSSVEKRVQLVVAAAEAYAAALWGS
jgi:hypothetical protein